MQWEPVCNMELRQAKVMMEVEQQLPVMVGLKQRGGEGGGYRGGSVVLAQGQI